MLIKDADRKLEMAITIAITVKSPWFDISSIADQEIPGYLYSNNDRIVYQTYIHRKKVSRGLHSAVMRHTRVAEKSQYYVITEELSRSMDLSSLNAILNIPSVIPTNSYVKGNEMYISFRFHSTFLQEVNSALVPLLSSDLKARIAFLGPSPGIVSILNDINANTAISVVRYTLSIPSDYEIVDLAVKKDREGLAELDPRTQQETLARLILYSNIPLRGNITAISETEMIYEASLQKRFVVESKSLEPGSRIPRIAYFLRISGERVEETVFIPEVEAQDYLNILFGKGSSDPDELPHLEFYSQLNKEMWEWL